MNNHIRCPLCDRNVRLSNNMRKVVRHAQVELYEEPVYVLPGVVHHITRTRLTKTVCPTSGMRDWEVRRLKETLKAFRV